MFITEDKHKTKEQLVAELGALRLEVNRLKQTVDRGKRTEEAIKEIVAVSSLEKGESFFTTISKQFAKILNADYTLIGERVMGDYESVRPINPGVRTKYESIRTLALCADGEIVDNIEYFLKDTPCENAIGQEPWSYRSGVVDLFPKDTLLKEMQVEGCVGIPLYDLKGVGIGIIAAFYREPIEDLEFTESILRIFASRTSAEIERKRAEKVSVESEEKFQHIVQSSPMGIHSYHLEPGDRLIFSGSNPAADRILGMDTRHLTGKTMEVAFPRLAATEVPGMYRDAVRSGHHRQTEYIAYQDRHVSRAFEVHAFRTKPGTAAAIFVDITRRKQVEDELYRLRNLLSNIINSMPSILIGVRPDGRVNQWNSEAEKSTGISSDEANGKMLTTLFPQLEKEMEKVRLAITSKTPLKEQKIPIKKDGCIQFTDITVYPLVANGVEGAVIRIDDVTDRVHIEEMMIQSEKMLSVGGLAAGMAHEINNPLAGILQNAQVMINRVTLDLPRNNQAAKESGTTIEAVTKYMEKREIINMLDAIIESGQRAAKIVENMLSFSRKSESTYSPCDLGELMDKTLELASNDYDLKKKYDFRRIELVKEYEPNMPRVFCENTKIQQVFLNVLKNGAQAMVVKWGNHEQRGQPRFTLRISRASDMAKIEIADNGPGLDKNQQKRVFEPFFTTKGIGIGTGLGLSVSYFIITENHQGTMAVNSEPGVGATFSILLPFKPKQKSIEEEN